MVAKIILAVVGVLYIALALFCSFSPQAASEKVGFKLLGGAGESEFITVYGGLELAMGLLFLMPLIKSDMLQYSILACLLIHVCLVVFRTISFFVFSDVSAFTTRLAMGEWAILIASSIAWWISQKPPQ